MSLVAFLLFCTWAGASDLDKSPPAITKNGRTYVFVDFISYRLDYAIDFENKRVTGRASISFESSERAYPLLDLVSKPDKVVLDGRTVRRGLPEIITPNGATTLRFVDEITNPGRHSLDITFNVIKNVRFTNSGIDFGWYMADAGVDRGFLERYAPANLQYDQFPMSLVVSLKGSHDYHQLFSNGQTKKVNANRWSIRFPAFYSSASFYFHLTHGMHVLEDRHQGVQRVFPVLVYSNDSSLLPKSLQTSHEVLEELERDYGPYLHDQLIVQIDEDYPGMEHSGAVVSSLYSLDHEIFHSWFGRGVMPQDGNASWIDEALARWRDRGYPRKKNENWLSDNLANLSPYSRLTPWGAYGTGADFMAHLDFIGEGIKPILAKLFKRFKRQSLSSENFFLFLETETGMSLKNETRYLTSD